MKICTAHWKVIRDSIEERDMSKLVAQSGKEAADNFVAELEGGEAPFDPLMSHHWHWVNGALRNGGLYLMTVDEKANPGNEGHFCPLCEYEKHMEGFDAKKDVDSVSDQMLEHCRKIGLLPKVQ